MTFGVFGGMEPNRQPCGFPLEQRRRNEPTHRTAAIMFLLSNESSQDYPKEEAATKHHREAMAVDVGLPIVQTAEHFSAGPIKKSSMHPPRDITVPQYRSNIPCIHHPQRLADGLFARAFCTVFIPSRSTDGKTQLDSIDCFRMSEHLSEVTIWACRARSQKRSSLLASGDPTSKLWVFRRTVVPTKTAVQKS
jgi:hypothetical protein